MMKCIGNLIKEKNKLELLNELILDTSYMHSGNKLLNTSLMKITDIVGVDFGYILNLMNESNNREVIGKYNLPYGFMEDLEQIRNCRDEVLEVFNGNTIIEVATEFKNPKIIRINKKYKIRTVIKIPIKGKENEICGVLILFSSKSSAHFDEHVLFLEALGNTIYVLLKKQKENEEYQNKLIRSEKLRALGELAGGIAHDFNNLLTSILGFSQIALSKQLDEEIKEYFKIILNAALDGKAIVDNIQAFNRKQSSHIWVPCSLNSIVQSSIEMVRPRWKNTYESIGIRLELVTELNSESEIYCSAHEIREMIINILMNAMDAMDNGGFLIIKTYDEGKKAILEIQDTGSGIPNEVKENIFEPFFSTKETRGTGLGLSIVKRIVEDHEGTIEVESEIGHGTKFKISFNKYCGNKDMLNAKAIAKETVKLDNLRVLVIDDIVKVGETIKKMLDTINIEADVEVYGVNVINRLSESKYDIIISDLSMPLMNGMEVAKLVKYKYPDIKFILMTGCPIDLQEKIANNIGYVLSKPFTIDELIIAIKYVARNTI